LCAKLFGQCFGATNHRPADKTNIGQLKLHYKTKQCRLLIPVSRWHQTGTQNIPGPPEDVHATFVNQSSVSLAWTQPEVDNANSNGNGNSSGNASPGDLITGDELASGAVDPAAAAGKDVANVGDATSGTTGTEDIEFIVQYGKVNNMTMYETVAKLENVSIYRFWTIDPLSICTNFSSAELFNPSPSPFSAPVSWLGKVFLFSGQAERFTD